MSTASAWRARTKEIANRVLLGQPQEMKLQVVRLLKTDPRFKDIDERLLRCWRRKDRDAGDFLIDKFDIELSSAIEKLGKGESK
jgi:hypothetical protein